MKQKKISLITAILINVNIIIGAGIFLNIRPLAKIAGPLSFASYLLGSIILLPFVFSLAKLAQAHPVPGGLYVYSKKYLSPSWGFVSGWVYFIGKTVSAAFLAYAFTSFFHQNISFLQPFSPLFLSSIVIFSLIFLNIAGMHIGGNIQFLFFATKIIPILFAIVFGLTFLQPSNFYNSFNTTKLLSPLISTIPIALYPLMGFEITCSIGHMIKKPNKNIFFAIFGSFLFVTVIYILFQAILFGVLGQEIFSAGEPLTLLANKIFYNPLVGQLITTCVFTSVIAGSFGMLTSNCWNLHTLAKEKHLPAEKFLSKLSKKDVPWASLLFEGAIACLLLVISKNQIALQSMSVFGVVFSFVLTAIAAYRATKQKQLAIKPIIPILSIASCFYILTLCFGKIVHAGISIPYIALLASGIAVSFTKKQLFKKFFS